MVCQEMSIPVFEALQGPQMSNSVPDDDDVVVMAEGKGAKGSFSHGLGERTERWEEIVVDNDCGDDNDISWYFNGRIPEVDSQILGVDGQIAEVDSHISRVDGHILGGVGRILGVAGTDVNIKGETDMGLITEFCSPKKKGICNTNYVSKSPSESLEFTNETLSSTIDNKNEDEDEFEASFQEVVCNSVNKDPGRNIAELTVQKEGNNKFPSEVRSKRSTETCHKTNCSKLENTEVESSHITNQKLVNPLSLSSSRCKEKEESDKLLSLLSAKLENKSKAFRRQVKMAEVFKGSRHFRQRSMDELLSENTSASIVNPAADTKIKYETSSTSKTSLQSMRKTGQAGFGKSAPPDMKTGKENFAGQNQESSAFVPKQTDKLKLIERQKQLLSMLGKRLSHGKEKEMQLAVEVVNSLFLSSGKTSLEELEIPLRMIHTELVQGPPSSFCQRMDGLLLECSTSYNNALGSLRSVPELRVFVALVNGDVTQEFRHVGLNKEYPIHRIIENEDDYKASFFNQGKDWHQCVTETLRKHKIGVLVAKGNVQDSVLDFCSSQCIAVLQNIAYPALQLLSYATDSAIVTYLADLREQDIGRPVTMETWDLGWAPSLVRKSKSKAGSDHEVKGIKACHYVLVKEVHDDRASWEGNRLSFIAGTS